MTNIAWNTSTNNCGYNSQTNQQFYNRKVWNSTPKCLKQAQNSYTTAKFGFGGDGNDRKLIENHEKRKKRIEHFQEAFMRKGLKLNVEKKLGNGKYSKVYKAHDFVSNRMVAIKAIDITELSDDVRKKFLPREIQCWKKLRHMFLVAMHAQYESGNMIFLAMEYGNHGDLLRFVQKNGAIEEAQASIYMSQLLNALDYMHSKLIAHRDVKLENIMIFDKCIKLSDFGFVRQMENNTLSDTFCGSKSYSSPELLKGTFYNPFLSDVWSAGVVGFVMVTDRMPFNESLHNSIIVENQRTRNYHIPNRTNLSENCINCIESMMTYDVKLRPTSKQCLALPWLKQHYVDEL